MKPSRLSLHPRVWLGVMVPAVLLTTLLALCLYFQTIFVTIVIALTFMRISTKARSSYEHAVGDRALHGWHRRVYGAGLVLFWFGMIAVLVSYSVSQLSEVPALVDPATRTLYDALHRSLGPHLPAWFMNDVLTTERVGAIQSALVEIAQGLVTEATAIFFHGILIVPLMFASFHGQSQYWIAQIRQRAPLSYLALFESVTREVALQLLQFFEAKVVQMMIFSAIACFGFFVAGVKGWLVFGVLAGVFNIIPYIGAILAGVGPVLVSLMVDDPTAMLGAVITVTIAGVLDGLYVMPFLVSARVRIHPLIAVVVFLAGARAFGVIGMLFAIPTFLVFQIILVNAYRELVRVYDPEADGPETTRQA